MDPGYLGASADFQSDAHHVATQRIVQTVGDPPMHRVEPATLRTLQRTQSNPSDAQAHRNPTASSAGRSLSGLDQCVLHLANQAGRYVPANLHHPPSRVDDTRIQAGLKPPCVWKQRLCRSLLKSGMQGLKFKEMSGKAGKCSSDPREFATRTNNCTALKPKVSPIFALIRARRARVQRKAAMAQSSAKPCGLRHAGRIGQALVTAQAW